MKPRLLVFCVPFLFAPAFAAQFRLAKRDETQRRTEKFCSI